MTDNSQSNGKPEQTSEPLTSQVKPVEERRNPKILQSVTGARISIEALVERIIEQFNLEHNSDSDVFLAADTRGQRMRLVSDVAKYIFAVESLQLMPDEQASIIHRVFGEIYGYGPLDPLLSDERVTTISLEGVDKASVRYGRSEDLTVLDSIFTDNFHLDDTVRRILRDARATYIEGMSFIEVGMEYDGRRVSINIAFPPFTIETTVDIRVHPKQMPSLDDLVASEFMTEDAALFLRALAKSEHGFVIVGEPESGKSTLLSALTHELPNPEKVISIERTGEFRPPEALEQLVVKWGYNSEMPIPFAEQVENAIAKSPDCIIIDEVLTDKAEAVNLPLSMDNPPRQIWAFRGGSITKRLRSAITMVAQRANPSDPEGISKAVYDRLPFVIITKRNKAKKKLELLEILEWQYPDGSDYPDLISLMEQGWEGIEVTGRTPQNVLDLPVDFWEK